MATPAEAFPDFEEESLNSEVAAHLGRIPHEYEQDGELVEILGPGNFPTILHAYMLNRFEHQTQDLDVEKHQQLLREYEIGRFITAAINKVYESDRSSLIDPALMAPMRASSLETRTTHEIVILEAAPYLPPTVSPEVFRDPPFPE
jgi:hypothetical protein